MALRIADSLRHRIALFMVVALGVVAGALITMSYRAAGSRSVAEAEIAMEVAAERAAGIVDQQLAPIPSLLGAVARVMHQPDADAAFDDAALALLSAHPTLYQLYEARPDGTFVSVARADPRLLAALGLPAQARDGFVRNRIAADKGVQQLAWRSEDDATWHDAPPRTTTYDPRTRPWYVKARDGAGVQWTAPYRFSFGGVFGLTAAQATWDDRGGLTAVVAIDVMTSVLNREVARIRIPGGGRRLLAYDDGTLLVHAGIERLRGGDAGAASQIAQLAGTEDAIDLLVFEAARGSISLVQLVHEGRAWIGTVRPVPSSVLGRIVFLAAAPLDALTAAGREQALRELAVGVALLIAALVATILLAGPVISRPIERLAIAARRIRAEGVTADVALPRGGASEIRELSTAFEEMVASLRAHTAELTALNADLERRVRERTAELAEARDRAEDAARAKATFLATMSHEIRTPMTGVVGMLDLLADGTLDAGQRELVELCTSSAGMLRTIIDDILDFSKIEAGKVALESLPVDLEALAGEVGDLLAPRAAAAGIALVLDVAPAAPHRITGDPARLRQVLLNLAGNAVKFTKVGHVAIRIGELRDGAAEIAVADTGIGLTAAQRARLFQPFEQAEPGTTRQFGGTGLGLAICRRLVGLMDGTIEVDSVPGQGSVFRVRIPAGASAPRQPDRCLEALPIAVAIAEPALAAVVARDLAGAGAAVGAPAPAVTVTDAADVPHPGARVLLLPRAAHSTVRREDAGATVCPLPVRPSQLIDAVAVAAGRRASKTIVQPSDARDAAAPLPATLRILVAEDTPTSRLAIVRMLEREGVAPVVCENGAVAWSHLQTAPFDLVITDCQMPELDGYDLTRRLRALEAAQPQRPRTRVCALSASVLQGEIDQCFAAGMDCFLGKPIVRRELGVMLRAQLADRLAGPAPPTAAPRADDPAPAVPSEPVLDLSEFEALFDGVTDELRTIVRDFVALARQQVAQLLAEMAQADPRPGARTAHALAGNALSTGAVALGHRVRAIEVALKSGAIDAARAATPAVQAALAALEARVATL